MATGLLGFLRRHGPREGWLLFLVAFFTLMMLPAAAGAAAWVPGIGLYLGAITAVAYLAPVGLTRLRGLPGWGAVLILAGLGLLVNTLLSGWALAPQAPPGTPLIAVPLLRVGGALREMAVHLATWAGDVVSGGAAQDNVVFLWLIGLVVWAAVAFAGWWLFRRHRPLVAMLPPLALLATNLYYTMAGRWALVPFLVGMVMTVVLAVQADREQAWQREGLDYSTEVRLDTLAAGLFFAVLVFAVTVPMPRVIVQPTARWFADLTEEPTAAVAQAGRQLFPGLKRQPRSLIAAGGAAGTLPRSYLLGSGPELSDQPVLRVTVDGESGEVARPGTWYWRALTFDTYTGQGWTNGPVDAERFAAGEAWTEEVEPRRRPLRQSVEVLRSGDTALYAAGYPLSSDRPYEALLRSSPDAAEGDPVALTGGSRRYQVLSLVPDADEATLRVAGRDYPPGIAQTYLALPGVPARVIELARRLTRSVDNPYDQALALQRFLRRYPYTLDVEPAPAKQDVVDYFLFDAQEGYCDYYASAMVVMARSLGIPARLATGYATGSYDAATASYLVAEDSAHSWPELYFPEVGWVPFEPTGGRAALDWGDVPPPQLAGPAQPPVFGQAAGDLQAFREEDYRRQRVRWLVALPLLAVAALAAVLWWRRRPEPALPALYERLGRWGRRLGRPPGDGETAGEFGRGLSRQLDGGKAAEVLAFVGEFEAAQYGRGDQAAARGTWRRLEPALRRLWVGRVVRRGGEDVEGGGT